MAVGDRVVSVVLNANVRDFVTGMRAAANATYETDKEFDKLEARRDGLKMLGTAGVAVGTAITAGLGVAISKFVEFDSAMSNVQAATHESAENMATLREAALDAGARTVYSATEAAGAIEELSKAGLSTADILGGALDGALDAAAAGGMDVARTAELMASTLAQFNLKGEDAGHVADLLAAGAGKANGDMEDLGQALNQAGLVANQFGMSVDDTVGTLAAFANAGMLGSDAGTSLRTMLLRLANPTKEVSELMDQVGIHAYDTQGDFVGLDNLAGQLQQSLGGMTQAQRDQTLAMIFGQDAIRGANILMNEGTEGIQSWTDAVNDQGYAQETAAMRLDNLAGDWEQFTGALETAAIAMGSAADGPLRFLVQALTNLVDGFNGLPEGAQTAVTWIAAVTGGAALLGGGLLLLLPKLANARRAMGELGITAGKVRTGVGTLASLGFSPLGLAIGVATTAMTMFISSQADAAAQVEGFRGALEQGTEAVADMANEALQLDKFTVGNFWKYGFFNKSALDAAEDMGISLRDVQDAATGNEEAFGRVRDQLDAIGAADPWSTGLVGSNELQTNSAILLDTLGKVNGQIDEADRLNKQSAESQGENAEATGQAADANSDAADSASAYNAELEAQEQAAADAQEQIDSLIDSIRNYSTVAGDTQENQDKLTRAINDSHDAFQTFIDDGGTAEEAMHGQTDGALDLRDMMFSLNNQALDTAAGIKESGGTLDDATQSYLRGRDRIIEMMTQLGLSSDEANAWADEMFGPTDQVEGYLNDVEAAADQVAASDPTVNISETGASYVNGVLDGVQANANATPDVHMAVLQRGAEDVQRRLQAVKTGAQQIPDAWVRITENGANQVMTQAYAVSRAINSIPGYREVVINQVTRTTGADRGAVGAAYNADGGFYNYQAFADGGFTGPGIYRGGANIHKFAEPETGWEAYISGKPSARDRNVQIWEQAGDRLGVKDSGPLVGELTFVSSGNVQADVSEAMFHLNAYNRGGRRRG